jgi:hypothetical protein
MLIFQGGDLMHKRSDAVSSTKKAARPGRRGSARFLIVSVLGLLVLFGSAQVASAAEVPVPELLKGATGPTGPAGPEGKEGAKGVTGPTGSGGGGGSARETEAGKLASGKSETGTWSANLQVAAGAPQAQADGAISFPITLPAKILAANVKYLNEKQVGEPGSIPGCIGSGQEPIAEPGFLCVYQGATATVGSLESEWKEAKFFGLEDPVGNLNMNAAGKPSGLIGELVVFRTNTFTEAPSTIPAAASLTAAGSWAVTAK